MAQGKIHWSGGCLRSHTYKHARPYSAERFKGLAAEQPDRFCSDCAKAARLALAAESAPKPDTVRSAPCRCGSCAINPSQNGRIEGLDLDLCDVCYWRKRATRAYWDTRRNPLPPDATWPKPRPISEAPTDEAFLGFVSADKNQTVLPGWYRMTAATAAVMDSVTGWVILGAIPYRDQHFTITRLTVTHFLPLPPEVTS